MLLRIGCAVTFGCLILAQANALAAEAAGGQAETAERPLPAAPDALIQGLADPDRAFAERCAAALIERRAVSELETAVSSAPDALGAKCLVLLSRLLEKEPARLAAICGACLSIPREATSTAALGLLAGLRVRKQIEPVMAFLMNAHRLESAIARFRLEAVCIRTLEAITGRRFFHLECLECGNTEGLSLKEPCPRCRARMVREMADADKWIAWWKEERAKDAPNSGPEPARTEAPALSPRAE